MAWKLLMLYVGIIGNKNDSYDDKMFTEVSSTV